MKKAKIILPLACALLLFGCDSSSSSSSSCSDWRECVCKDSVGSISLYMAGQDPGESSSGEKATATMSVGEEKTAYVSLVCIWDAYVKYSFSDPSVAKIEVDHVNTSGGSVILVNCQVTALKEGTTTIKASYGEVSSELELTVLAPSSSQSA